MASREDRERALKNRPIEELKKLLRDVESKAYGLPSGWLREYGLPENERRSNITRILDLADLIPIFGKAVDTLLGLTPDDERQIRAAEDVAGAAKTSAAAARRSAWYTAILAGVGIAGVVLTAATSRLQCRSCQPPRTPALDNPIVTTLPAAQHAP